MNVDQNIDENPFTTDTIQAAIDSTIRERFISSRNSSMIVGHSIPSTENVRHILASITFPSGCRLLHIGSGIGYLTAILSHLVTELIAIDRDESMVKQASIHTKNLGLTNIQLLHGDGKYGSPDHAPFDIILVSTPSLQDYSALLYQLTPHGKLITLEGNNDKLMHLVQYSQNQFGNLDRKDLKTINFSGKHDNILIPPEVVDTKLMNKAKALAKANGTFVIDELHKLVDVKDIDLYRSMADQHGLSLGNVDQLLQKADPSIFDSFSRAFLDHNHMIPLYIEITTLYVATNNPDTSIEDIQRVYPDYDIKKILVTPTDFLRLWSALDLSVQARMDSYKTDIADKSSEKDLLDKDKAHIEPRLISLFFALMLDAIGENASDIHIEQYSGRVRIRLRVDGDLHDITRFLLTPKEINGLINVIKLRGEINIAEQRLPQSGRSSLQAGGVQYDLRIQIQPSLHGEHVVIRLLPQTGNVIAVENLGFSTAMAKHYKRLLNNPVGLVLVVGPTGSGKSTTLYAGLQLLANDGRRKVISVEDPIEYSIDNIQQTRTRPDIGFNFSDAMRAFVRQDPDVILVGEIRDQETALEAIRASQTGHVVLSTLHCNDATDSLQRMYDLGVHPNSIASELLAVIAQRLAKRICPNCKKSVVPDEKIIAEVFPDGIPIGFRCYEGQGCDECGGKGTHGRVAVVEYMHVNYDIREAISRQPSIIELRSLALDAGLLTMRDSALDHVIQGSIPLSELPRILPAERMAPEPRGQLDK